MSRIFRTLPCFGVMVGGLTLICAPALAASPPAYCTPTSTSGPKKCSASGPSCGCSSSANHASAETTHQNITVYGSGSRHSYTVPTIEAWGKTPVALKDIPQSVSVITQQRMEDSNMLTMTDAMRQINGIRVMPASTANSNFYSRGYQLTTSVDGTPNASGTLNNASFDLSMYDRIDAEISQKGCTSG
ncbi:TonB-dependent receptor plug domain-containing protein [Acetobacter sp. A11-2]|uniref:TonB-dependent receptor plug domain-containing protein n=1 Tax=Acetobacter sp. A11-2 TaxID=3157859 RepID=UPI0038D0C453